MSVSLTTMNTLWGKGTSLKAYLALPRHPAGTLSRVGVPVLMSEFIGQYPTIQANAGVVTTLAGTAGTYGSTDGTGPAASFYLSYGVAVDSAGNLYVADSGNNVIRKITPLAVVTTFATGFAVPSGIAVDSAGTLYVGDQVNSTIRKITPGGVVTTLAGTANSNGSTDAIGSAARFYYPYGVAVDSAGNVYVADTSNNTIRKITAAGVVTTLAGSPPPTATGSTDGIGSAARFNSPRGVAVDSSGNVYVADTNNNTIRKITAAGVVTTLAGSAASFKNPYGIAVDSSGNVYVADTSNCTIRKITAAGVVTTLAGSALSIGSLDGIGSAANFSYPYGVAVDSIGTLYVADSYNFTIRKMK